MSSTHHDIKGLISALLVPFTAEGKINEKGLRQIVRHNLDKMQVDGLYVGGSTGENFMLDTASKKEIFAIVKDEAGDKGALIAQIGSPNLYEAIELDNTPPVWAIRPFLPSPRFITNSLSRKSNNIISTSSPRLITA